jgi:hypothetical protein
MDGSCPIEIEVLKAVPPSKAPNQDNCHKDFQVPYTSANGVRVIAMSGGGTNAGELENEDGKVPVLGNNPQPRSVDPDENGLLFLGEEGTVFVRRGMIVASDKKIIC